MEKYSADIIKDKRIAIVGPAGHMLNSNLGSEIDSYDLIVKINDSIPGDLSSDFGSRVDILVVGKEFVESMKKETIVKLLDSNCKLIVCKMISSSAIASKLFNLAKGKINVEFITARERKQMFNIGEGMMPNSGVFCMKYFSDLNPTSISVFGFDFYKTIISNGEVVTNKDLSCGSENHNIKPQINFVRQMIKSKKIIPSNELSECIEKSNLIDNNLEDYLSGKRVVFVGPARHMQGRGLGKEIDSFEVVIRVNCSMDIKDLDSFGGRCDVLYAANFLSASLNEKEINRLCKLGVKFIVTKFSGATAYFKKLKKLCDGKINLTSIGRGLYYQYRQLCGNTPPNTGVVGIMHVSDMSVKSMTLYGFDFYMTGYLDGYQNKTEKDLLNPVNWGQHNPYRQVIGLNEKFSGKDNVIIDQHMREVFDIIIENGDSREQ